MARQHRPDGFDLHPDTISIKYGEEATPNAPEPGDVVSPIHRLSRRIPRPLRSGRKPTLDGANHAQ